MDGSQQKLALPLSYHRTFSLKYLSSEHAANSKMSLFQFLLNISQSLYSERPLPHTANWLWN